MTAATKAKKAARQLGNNKPRAADARILPRKSLDFLMSLCVSFLELH
jgi:hypothetical protein